MLLIQSGMENFQGRIVLQCRRYRKGSLAPCTEPAYCRCYVNTAKMLISELEARVKEVYREYRLPDAAALNARLLLRFAQLSGTGRVRQTHFFAGRFENLYIERADMPELEPVLQAFHEQAGNWLGRVPGSMRAGFWFNAMGPGHVTAPHHHDENDELLSAVYYVRVPEHCGSLVLHASEQSLTVTPEPGKLVMFAPAILHEVTENRSREMRLSVGMNIGPV